MKKALIATTSMAVVGIALTACAGTDTANRVVLPLDHGPRAQTTPWSNKQRLLRAEQEARTKAEGQGTLKSDTGK